MNGAPMFDRPLFEVIVPTSHPEGRRLVSAAYVRSLIGSPEADDAVLELLIDGVCDDCAAYCKLARSRAEVPTFGRESLRATWAALDTSREPARGRTLALPHRVPVTAIEVSEGGSDLVEGTDFRLLGGGLVERLGGDWGTGEIVADYTAGWLLGVDASAYDGITEPVPAGLQNRIVEQVKMKYLGRRRDDSLRSESTETVGSASYNYAGGDGGIGRSGLLVALESALAPYRRQVIA
jgi:hypothetical protein